MKEMPRHQDTSIGPYHLTRLLGVGPVSRVYLAERQDWPDRQIALKLFEAVPLHTLEEKDLALDEVRLLACMEHPSILPVLDDGLHEDMLYLVTPYIKEDSLRQRLAATVDNHPLQLQEALALLRQIGEALQFAHSQQLVHANLKPENILLPGNDKALLADFLLPSLVKSERAARILSTFAALYMAPEQFRGVTTPLSDQYALACLAYELLTGQPPFEADNAMSLARQHATREPVSPSKLLSTSEPRIDQALLKALVKRPEGRYPDIQTFLVELGAISPLEALASTPEVASVTMSPQVVSSIPGIIAEIEPLQKDLPASITVFDQETIKQPMLKTVSAAMVSGMYGAVTNAMRAVRPRPLINITRQSNPGLVFSPQTLARVQSATRFGRREIWLIAGLVLLVMLVSISGIVLFFNAASGHTSSLSQAQKKGSITTLALTSSPVVTPTATSVNDASSSSPTATATTKPVKPKPTSTATPIPTKRPTATPVKQASLSCRVTYTFSARWPDNFIASLTITNTGTSAIQGWRLAFTFPGTQHISHGWNGNFTQNGTQVNITNANYNATLQPGSSTSPAFQASLHGENNRPASFSLNGVTCQ